ncbi:MAG: TetR/AcrR family transcriptional regulator [Bacteroidales bacterium]|nr:TetR/AcrR family transcriptional regulator [Bacteroidales bacterium]
MVLTERQTEIIDKSIEIIGTKGIQGLTIKNLSKEIGISEPAIYRHFESKTAILISILDNFKEMATFMGDMMEENQGPAVDKIEFMFSRIIDIFSQTPYFISVVFSEEIFRNEAVLKNKIVEIMDFNEKTVEGIITAGQERNEIRTDIDGNTLALIVMGSLRFRVKQWDLKDYHGNMVKEGGELINNLKLILAKN